MNRRDFLWSGLAATLPTAPLAATASLGTMQPPIAPPGDYQFTLHGVTVRDPYRWLKDQSYPTVDDPAVLAYLKAENAYFDDHMGQHAAKVDAIYGQLKGRVAPDDAGVPWPDGDWLYWWAYETGSQYRCWFRRPRAGGAAQLMLSEPVLAAGSDYFRLSAFSTSPDGRLLAYSVDRDGSERFTLVIRDLASGRDLETVATDSWGDVAWTADSTGLVWTQNSSEWRATKAWLHRLGQRDDRLLYEEDVASGYWVGVSQTQDRRYIMVACEIATTTEVRLIDAARADAPLRLVRARRDGVRYAVDSREDRLFILTNDGNINFRIATAPHTDPGHWAPLLDGAPGVYLTGMTAFTSYLAVEERLGGLDQIRLIFPDGRERLVPFPEPTYTATLGANAEPDAPELRIAYSSMVTPNTVFDYQVADDWLQTRKVQHIPSGYDASAYVSERLMAPARDGTLVPVSIVYRRDYRRDGSQPLHVYGYGAYGIATQPWFSSSRLTLLDRGFAFAIAHVRGGDELGWQWYLDGKLDKRANSFNDFIDVTRHLHGKGFGRPGFTSAEGGSAGGWLVGTAVTQAPELWRAVIADVPFVDVVNTMLDTSLPLTRGEWPEWGNPATDPEVFRRLLALSPYDQTRPQPYPAMLVRGGISDPRVTYWEPAKWVARLRASKTDRNLLLLKINMDAGHGGKSGRFDALREVAESYAFLLLAFDGKAVEK